AKLIFPADSPPAADRGPGEGHAILSSGGKDSLLTFGLLRELGLAPHPIFLNESGRHWYTALNGYRYLRAEWPQTARVWTDSDRMFSWMLRHLPFVRPDFARLRADDYPVRLWTVAVFLFGALPLVRKRGLGRILIGDEFDTTVRTSYRGITHYDGLYDQSRYFDNALSRYYRRKNWGIAQFSVLRPMSEFLIQKTLVERYPDLQAHQVSCHAAHLEGEQVYPCGNCEKCRRIVAMLVALGMDPSHCGYDDDQVREVLGSLPEHGLHQEGEGVEHIAWMLHRAGVLDAGRIGARRARQHREVTHLRFDAEHAPMDGIPRDLRRPLYKLLLQHAEGAMVRQGRIWKSVDLLNSPDLTAPYPFETGPARRDEALEGMEGREHLLAEMTWQQARVRLKETDLALLPVGSIEQHGPHLPLDTDAWDADYLSRRVAERCSRPRPLVLPLISYGVSYHHDDFSGTLSVGPDVLSRLVLEVGISAARNGITKLVIVNGHGGNVPALQFAAQMINRDAHIFTCVESGETSDSDIAKLTDTPNDVHAGEVETSTSLATRPDLVRIDRARRYVPRFSSQYLDFTSARSVEWYARTAKLSRSGVLGDPTRASREKGERFWEIMTDHLVAFVEFLKGLTLDQIYERRY
ncbi:MAG: creatininase family protein, partial [Acidobacteriota bacterium]